MAAAGEAAVSASALSASGGAKAFADRSAIEPTGGDDPIIDDHATRPAENRDTVQTAAECKTPEPRAGLLTPRSGQLRCVEVSETHLDPPHATSCLAQAEAVAVSHITHNA
ncbi:hypothetical protein [Brevundimonas bacteroides]|uniref:hypothetical protein n=1 Tax=Brevundimonas bacteroides TaxID=74311 RepID=UPI0004974C66|nr:hypothetical protein [Brevundimonas bacteroides]